MKKQFEATMLYKQMEKEKNANIKKVAEAIKKSKEIFDKWA